jgi:transcriptional regulator with XRE-family HTH domain
MDRKKLGKVIHDLRTDRNLSEFWCGRKIRENTKTWRLIEAGEISITVDTLFDIAKCFMIAPVEILQKVDNYLPRMDHSGIIETEADIPKEAKFVKFSQLPIHDIEGYQARGFYTQKQIDKSREAARARNKKIKEYESKKLPQ